MSETVDTRAVVMKFDNRNFERNVATTMNTVDKLEKKLKFKGASEGLDDLEKSVRKISFKSLTSGVEEVIAKFDLLDVAKTRVFSRMVDEAYSAGKNMVKSLSIDQITSGWDKYVDKTGSVQTLMNTTGKSIDEINSVLNKLMLYSDETSYGFTDMTSSLAQLTSAGGDISKLTPMIMGIANATAYAGKGASEFSRVIYNLNQSYGMGYLQYADWRSVELAGVSSQQLKQVIIDTAKELGKLSKAGKTANGNLVDIGTFGSTLKDKWADTEVMEAAFGKFATFSEAVLDSLEAGQYDTGAEAISALADGYDELAVKSFKAAQEAKSLTEAIEATKDAVSSGWMTSFELLFGNYEEAKELWSGLADTLWDAFASGADRRNRVLKSGLQVPWEDLCKQITEAGGNAEEYLTLVEQAARDHKIEVDKLVEQYGSFTAVIKAGKLPTKIFKEALGKLSGALDNLNGATSTTVENLEHFQSVVTKVIRGDFGSGVTRVNKLTAAGEDYATIQKLVNKVWERNGKTWKNTTITAEDLTEVLATMGEAELKSIGYTEEQVEQLKALAEQAEKTGTPLNELIERMSYKKTGRELLVESFQNALEALFKPLRAVKEAWAETFPENEAGNALYRLLEKINEFTESLIISDDTATNFKTVVEGLFAGFQIANSMFSMTFTAGLKILTAVLGLFDMNIVDLAAHIANVIIKARDWIKENTIFINHIDKIAQIIAEVINGISRCVKAFKGLNSVQRIVENVHEAVSNFFNSFGIELKEWNIDGIIKSIRSFFDNIERWIHSLDNSEHLGRDIVAGIAKGITGAASGAWKAISGLASGLLERFTSFFRIASPSKLMMKMGGFLVAGLIAGIINSKTGLFNYIGSFMSEGLDVFSGGFNTLVSYFGDGAGSILDVVKMMCGKIGESLKLIDFSPFVSIGMSVGLIVMLKQLLKVTETIISPVKAVSEGIANVAKSIAGVGTSIKKAIDSKVKVNKVKEYGRVILEVAAAVALLAASVWLLSKVDGDRLWVSVGALAALVGILTVFVGITTLLSKLSGDGGMTSVLSLISLAVGLKILVNTLKTLSEMTAEQTKTGLKSLTVLVGELIAFMIAYAAVSNYSDDVNQVGKTMLLFSASLWVMSRIIKMCGSMSSKELTRGIGAVTALGVLMVALVNATSKTRSTKVVKMGGTLIAITVALGLMVGVVKLCNLLDADELLHGVAAMTVFAIFIAAFIKVASMAGENAGKASLLLVGVAVSMGMMAAVIKVIGGFTTEEITKGLLAVGMLSVFFALLIKVSEKAGSQAAKAGVMLLEVSAAMLILTGVIWLMGNIPLDELAQGILAIAAVSLLFMGLIRATKSLENLKLAPFIVLLISIGMICGILITLSLLGADKVLPAAAALTMILGALALVILSTKLLPEGKKAYTAVGVLGATVGVVVALVAAIAAIMALIEHNGLGDTVQKGIERFAEMMVALIPALTEFMLATFAIAVLATALDKLHVKTSKVATTALVFGEVGAIIAALVIGISLLSGYLLDADKAVSGVATFGKLFDALLPFITAAGVITAAIASISAIPTVNAGKTALLGLDFGLVGAILAALVLGIGTVTDIIGGSHDLVNGCKLFSDMMATLAPVLTVMAGFFGALAAVSAILGPTASTAALGTVGFAAAFDVVVGLIGLLAGCIGELMGMMNETDAQKLLTGLDRFTAMMEKIGEAIGNFVGGLVGGVFGGVIQGVGNGIAALIGTVADQLEKLFDVCGEFDMDPESVEALGALADALLAFGGAGVLNLFTTWLSGGKAIGDVFEEQMGGLGRGLAAFSNAISDADIDLPKAEAAAGIIKVLAEASRAIPSTGGWVQRIIGEKDVKGFGEGLSAMATGLGNFVHILAKESFSDDTITQADLAAQIIERLATAAKSIPNSGGWLGAIVGENDLDKWSEGLPTVAQGIADFIAKFGQNGLSSNQVTIADRAAQIIESLAAASAEIPNTGGLLADLIGDNDLAKFGTGLGRVGYGIKAFIDHVGTLTESQCAAAETAASVIVSLAEAAQEVPNTGGLLADLVGDNDIGDFSEDFSTLGKNICAFAEALGSLRKGQVDAINVVTPLVNSLTALGGGTDALSNFANFGQQFSSWLPEFGAKLLEFVEAFPPSSDINNACYKMAILFAKIDEATRMDLTSLLEFTDALGDVGDSGVASFVESFNGAMTSLDVDETVTIFADKLTSGFSSSKNTNKIKKAINTLVDEIVSAFKSDTNAGKMKNAATSLIDGLVVGLKDEGSINKLYQQAKVLGQTVVKGEMDGQESHSPSAAMIRAAHYIGDGLVTGLKEITPMVQSAGQRLGSSLTRGIGASVRAVNAALDTDMECTPVIAPVVDLSRAREGIEAISGVFSNPGVVGVRANIEAVSRAVEEKRQNGNNGDVVDAIDKLKKSVDGMERSSTTINGITYSGDSEVEAAVQQLVRAVIKEGRT